MSIHQDEHYPSGFAVPRISALAIPQLAAKIDRHVSAVLSVSGTDAARSTTMAAIQRAQGDGDLSESDVQRLTAIVTTDDYDAHALYLEALDDPTGSEFAAVLLGLAQLRRDPATAPTPTARSADEPHTHVFSDADLIALGLLGGPITAVAIGLAVASEHIHFD